MRKPLFLGILALFTTSLSFAQCDRWQQHIDLEMSVSLNVKNHNFNGTQVLTYTNNSPHDLSELYFHLYFNAFRPGSEMDVRSRTIEDPDSRVTDRIFNLKPSEYGSLKVTSFTQGKQSAIIEHMGTVLKVNLPQPIKSGESGKFNLAFEGQVPLQIRRSGRDNKEGVAYSMTQWYPKVAEYDHRGWHPDPYVGREFYGVWGNYDVKLTLDADYVVASTGLIQNPKEVGHGYAAVDSKKRKLKELTWHFKADNVHDFAWAADPDYVHTTAQVPDGPLLHFFRKDKDDLKENWDQLEGYMVKTVQFMSKNFGEYPYPVYNFVQGGDGGMEYPMLTLITGKRRLGSLVGVSVHEFAHSWYYGILATNESRFPWMDEGFTQFASNITMEHLFPPKEKVDSHRRAYSGYFDLVGRGKDEPMVLHGDHFVTNYAYGVNAYNKGEMFVAQLRPVVGEKVLKSCLMDYYDVCKFKHPEPIDFERVVEKHSGLTLDWYFDQWINTTRTLDIAATGIWESKKGTVVQLTNKSHMLMPVDVTITKNNGDRINYFVPISLMLGSKSGESENFEFKTQEPWQWTNPTYEFVVDVPMSEIRSVQLDPLERLADIERSNNRLEPPSGKGVIKR